MAVEIFLWVLQALLAAAFGLSGSMKIVRAREQLIAQNPERLAWANDFSDANVKLIGLVELVGAFGLILPWATDVAPALTPLAAAGLALTMLTAIAVHVRRGDPAPSFVAPFALMTLSVVAAVGLFTQL